MKNERLKRLGEAGSMMVEALAMLGLISMVTPIIYKKAAERNSEIQDVNAAAQMRSLIRAADEYAQDNYNKIVTGETVSQPDCVVKNVTFNGWNADGSKKIPVAHLCGYLPYGFLDKDGKVKADRVFGQDYEVSINKKESGINNRQSLTSFVLAKPMQSGKKTKVRTSRIASMIGSNGGSVDKDGNAIGVQGMWIVDNAATALDFDTDLVTEGAIITSSVQPITSGSGNHDLLHRTKQSKEILNTMETTLYMGANSIKNINQLVVTATNAHKTSGFEKDKALDIQDGAGAYIDGMISVAKGNFIVDGTTGDTETKGTLKAADGAFFADTTGIVVDGKADITGDLKVDGSAGVGGEVKAGYKFSVAGGNAYIDGELDVKDKVKIGTPNLAGKDYKLAVKGDALVDGDLVVTQRFSAPEIGTADLLAGSTKANYASKNKADFTLHAEETQVRLGGVSDKNLVVAKATGNTTINSGNLSVKKSSVAGSEVFKVDTASNNVYAQGLRAGGKGDGTGEHALVVGKDGNYDITMKRRTAGSKVEVLDNTGTNALLIDKDVSTLRKGTATIASEVVAKSGGVEVLAKNAAKQAGVYVKPEEVALSLNKNDGTNNKNVRLYRNNTENRLWIGENTELKVISGSGGGSKDAIFQVDPNPTSARKTGKFAANSETSKGSVYVRKGVIEVASGDTRARGQNFEKKGMKEDMGYIRADMIVSNTDVDASAMQTTEQKYLSALSSANLAGVSGSTVKYDAYMVNPAYTSVMHDIKLGTRGGARLSDILPDFINRGIYVVDNTYKEKPNLPVLAQSGGMRTVIARATQEGAMVPAPADKTTPTSPWAGVVPTPTCPPGYRKVITVAPYSFNMAQAGVVGKSGRTGSTEEFYQPIDPNRQADEALDPTRDTLNFQKSTWLRSRAIPHYSNGNDSKPGDFEGWSVLVGFVYPENIYNPTGAGITTNGYYIEHQAQITKDSTYNIIWNLFPVYYADIEAYVNVYCYFERENFNGNTVDKTYDQLGNKYPVRKPLDKSNKSYNDRLHDPNLNYSDPW